MFYYKLSENSDYIEQATENKSIAKELGLQLTTEKNIILAWNGKLYIEGDEPQKPQSIINQEEIYRLKDELAETDYKIIKCSEYNLAGVALPYDIAELHIKRQALRDRINELEG